MKTADYSSRTGFTLTELMFAVALFGLVVSGTLGVYIMCRQMWHATSLSMQAHREGGLAVSRLIYGMGSNNGLRAVSTITSNANSWTFSTPRDGSKTIQYNQQASNIYWIDNVNQSSRICAHVSSFSISKSNASGIYIQLVVQQTEGRFIATITNRSFVVQRN